VAGLKRLDIRACHQAHAKPFRRGGKGRDEPSVLDLAVQRKSKSESHIRRKPRFEITSLFGAQSLNLESGSNLPVVTMLKLLFVLFGESQIERAGRIELDVRAALFPQGLSERRVKIAAAARQSEKLVRAVGFSLRREHPARRERRFATKPPPLD
jgi:hypothetical protein